MVKPAPDQKRTLYGRRLGRPLNATRKDALNSLLPELGIPEDLVSGHADLRPSALFPMPDAPLIFEIGFGNGEHLAQLMRQDPDSNYIGAEPFINGMSAFLKDIKDDPHDNIRVWMEDAIKVAKSLENACADKIYVLNPDPWPKTRHHKRRIISKDNLDQFERILKPGGQLIMSTDVADLADWMVTQTMIHGGFTWQANTAADWKTPPKGWIHTKYEHKGAKGSGSMSYLLFIKNT